MVPHLKWTYDVGAIRDNQSPVIGPSGPIFQTLDFAVKAVKPNGTVAWGQTIFTAFGSRLAPALSPDGAILYTTDDGDPTFDTFIGAYSTLDGRGGGHDFVALAAGGFANSGFSLALTRGGEPWAWGTNYHGELGVGALPGNASSSTKPVRVSGLSAATAIAAGEQHALALTGAGRVWAWGDNLYGQIGDGTTNDRALPGPVTALSDTVAIAAGANHSLAISAGRVWAWGSNEGGQIGNGRGGVPGDHAR